MEVKGMFGKKEPESPIEIVENWQGDSPIGREEEINSEDGYAILATTENGKWVIGNRLFYELNGVRIYTELDNVIFVNPNMNTMVIKKMERVQQEINPTNAEERQYILLYTEIGYEEAENELPLRWEAVTGRSQAYEACKINAPLIDLDHSIVIVENVSVDKALSVREFIEYMHNAKYVDDDFDVTDFD